MSTKFRVEPIDFAERNHCRVCHAHRRFHLATTDHSFVPGDAWMFEVRASELLPGDTIASVPKQRSSDDLLWVYRRK